MKITVILSYLIIFTVTAGSTQADILDDTKVLNLPLAQEIAMKNNPSLSAMSERVNQAKQRVKQARSLYWPSVNGAASSGNIDQPHNNLPNETYSIILDASWLLFDGFARKFSNMSADYGQRESVLANLDARRILLQNIAESYYGAQLARYNKEIAEANFSFNAKQADEAKISMEAGASSLSALLNFQVQMNNASTDILLAERDYDLAMSTLALLLGRESGLMPTGLQLEQVAMIDESEFIEITPDALITQAEKNRPDLLRMEIAEKSTQANVKVKEAAYYPALSLNGSINGSRYEDPGFEGDDFGSAISLNISGNLFRGQGDMARIAEAKAARREAVRNLEQYKNNVRKEVRQAITKLLQAREQLKLQRASVKLVSQARDLVEEGYKAGQESLARFNEAQRDLVQTQSRLALSLIALYTSRHSLRTVTGKSISLFMIEN